MIDLNEKRDDIISVATRTFEEIVDCPETVRSDTKKRKGIKVLVRQPNTRNLVLVSIKEPSEAAQFFAIEKAVRSDILDDGASQNSESPGLMRYPGSVTVDLHHFHGHSDNPYSLQASVSGLKAEEDVVVAMAVLTEVMKESGASMDDVYDFIVAGGGELPKCFHDKNHYLNAFFDF